jgi:DNA-directed RNA polymerase subunit RPC12/RpoP
VTVETVTTISLNDILAVRYKCAKCGGELSVPIGTEHSVPSGCQSCHARWFVSAHDPRLNGIFETINWLREAAKTVAQFPETDVPLDIRLEISNHSLTIHK